MLISLCHLGTSASFLSHCKAKLIKKLKSRNISQSEDIGDSEQATYILGGKRGTEGMGCCYAGAHGMGTVKALASARSIPGSPKP